MVVNEKTCLNIKKSKKSDFKVISLKSFIWDYVEGEIDSFLEYFLLFLIFGNVVLLCISTMVLDKDCLGDDCVRLGDDDSPYGVIFNQLEFYSVCIFTIEYILRVFSCTEDEELQHLNPLQARFEYCTRFFLIVDLLSVLPYWVYLCATTDSPSFSTAIRLFRLIRLLKAEKYVNAFQLLDDVLSKNKTILIASSFYAFLVWIIASVALFMVEKNNDDEDTAIMFQSIPAALYPTLMMLTGNVPDGNYSPLGKLIVSFKALIGVCIFAIPTGVFASGFARAIEKATHETMLD